MKSIKIKKKELFNYGFISLSLILLIVLYYLNFSGFYFPNDGAYYYAVANNLINSGELKDPIYSPPRELLTPQISHIFLIAALKYFFGKLWIISYILIQILLFILAYYFLKQSIFKQSLSYNSTNIYFGLILFIPIFLRNFTNFSLEGIYFPLLIIFISVVWNIIFENKKNFIIYTLTLIIGVILTFYRVQFLVLLLPLGIIAIYKCKFESAYIICIFTSIVFISGLIYQLFIEQLILQDVKEKVFLDLSLVPYSLFINTINFFTFPFFHEKFINNLSFINLKTSLTVMLICTVIYYQYKKQVVSSKLFLFISFTIFLNLLFISIFTFPSQRYFLTPFLFLAIYFASLFSEINFKKLSIWISSFYITLILIILSFVAYDSYQSRNSKTFSYLNIIDFVNTKNLKIDNLVCDEPRIYYWYSNKSCTNIAKSRTDYRTKVVNNLDPLNLWIIGHEKFINEIIQQENLKNIIFVYEYGQVKLFKNN